MSKLAKKGVMSIKPYQPGKPIDEVKRELLLDEVYKLASNENSLGPSKKALTAIKDALSDLNRYPDGNCYYLKVEASKNLGFKPENFVFGNGSDELIAIIIQAFMNEDENAIIAEPTFLEYRLIAEAYGRRVKVVPSVNMKYDIDGMRKAIDDKTKLVFIANPDNPTGTYITDKQLTKFLENIPGDVIVVMDEAYYDFIDAKDYPDTVRHLKDKNLIILRTFSKAYGLAGLRVGFALANSELVECMNRVRQPFNVNSLAQVGASAALADTTHLKKTRQTVLKGKKFLYGALDRIGLSYVPSQTNFILVDVKKDSWDVFQKLLRYGVIVRDMKPYKLDSYIRVTIGTDKENRKFIEAVKKVIKED
ncbi:MAG: histidinol-phosphate transaminase [Candidatus Omnitrophota bacterium]|jgi:histidinol-phosphate aminotransferase